MTEQELREKIVKIIRNMDSESDTLDAITLGDIMRIADALIAAGIGDVRTAQEIGASATAMAVLEAAKAEHRAERAERALMTVCTNVIKDEEDDLAIEPRARVLYKAYLKQAEKELAEERKDD